MIAQKDEINWELFPNMHVDLESPDAYKTNFSASTYIVSDVDMNKTQFSIMPDRGQQRDSCKSQKTGAEGTRKLTISKPRIYRLETFKNVLRSISSGPFWSARSFFTSLCLIS